MYLEIVTPDKKVFSGEVVSATFPGTKGSFQVLTNHAPLISTLAKGKITYVGQDQKSTSIMVDGGVVEVLNNRISVLVEALLEENA
jgi:F-type H+-transporting ATPase subunit epsilon